MDDEDNNEEKKQIVKGKDFRRKGTRSFKPLRRKIEGLEEDLREWSGKSCCTVHQDL